MTKRPRSRYALASALLAWSLFAGASAGAGGPDPDRGRAVDLYDAGRFAEARDIIESIDRRGAADGALLYRLHFCLGAAGDREGAARILERARIALEAENESPATLEVPFYLANAYQNLGRKSEAQAVARAATDRLDSGALPKPESPIAIFRWAKLFQDQGRHDRAVPLYEEALAGFERLGGGYGANVRWAVRYLAEMAFAAAEFDRAERAYAKLVTLDPATAGDFNALAVARVRLGRYADAADAWREAVRLDPANADDPRYASRLALVASESGELPKTAPSGKTWRQIGREEIEAVLLDTANEVKQRRADALKAIEGGTGNDDARVSFEQDMATARGRFVAAGLEYACRRLPIRETAFREGYAVLIFQPGPWEWPGPAAGQK